MGIFDIGKIHGLMGSNLPAERIDVNTEYRETMDTLAGQSTDSIERLLYSFFGNVENAKQYGKDYVLEVKDFDIEICNYEDFRDMVDIRITQKVRLRLKNQEERDAEV